MAFGLSIEFKLKSQNKIGIFVFYELIEIKII